MDSAKNQLAERLQSANNILVTVSRDPSVDQLAACLALTILLNKLNKHSVAVFSGEVPSTLEFLQPDETIEKNTDSLRDFIIALDKDKADKLRYKVEDNVVRIFITPYKTSISEKDLEFSQGDFNVDVVVALGVRQQEDLDGAITAHGRILHDATVASINLSPDGGLGTINWHDPQASSLSELITELALEMGDNLLDNQIATALLTGIVAETKRFSNEKTSSQTMYASSALMAAGANQQLVATKLEEPAKPPAPLPPDQPSGTADSDSSQTDQPDADGTLSITHDNDGTEEKEKVPEVLDTPAPPAELPPPQPEESVADFPTPPEPPKPPEPPQPPKPPEPPSLPGSTLQPGSRLVTEPPALGGTLSANTRPEVLDPITDPFSLPASDTSQLLNRPAGQPANPGSVVEPAPAPANQAPFTPPPASWTPPSSPLPVVAPPATPITPVSSAAPAPLSSIDNGSQTLSEIESSVHSPHLNAPPADLGTARDEVSKALVDSNDVAPPPIQALNAQPLGTRLHDATPSMHNETIIPPGPVSPESADTNPQPAPSPDRLSPSPQVTDPQAPPPFPPPLFTNQSTTPPPAL